MSDGSGGENDNGSDNEAEIIQRKKDLAFLTGNADELNDDDDDDENEQSFVPGMYLKSAVYHSIDDIY